MKHCIDKLIVSIRLLPLSIIVMFLLFYYILLFDSFSANSYPIQTTMFVHPNQGTPYGRGQVITMSGPQINAVSNHIFQYVKMSSQLKCQNAFVNLSCTV